MIELMFEFLGDVVLIRIERNKVLFGSTQFGARLASIDGLKLDYAGVCREFPDLELSEKWREEAIQRFKKKIKEIKTEKEIALYLIDDLKKYGYIPRKMQVSGHRAMRL